jgi:hypothetical protein
MYCVSLPLPAEAVPVEIQTLAMQIPMTFDSKINGVLLIIIIPPLK